MQDGQGIALEDFCEDIVGKAQRGLRLGDEALASASGVDVADIRKLKAGERPGDHVVRGLAGPLGLDAEKLIRSARGDWFPEVEVPLGLFMENTSYHDMRVNAYVVWDPASRIGAVFDTGADARGLLDCARTRELRIEAIFLTHGHNDHIADLGRLRAAWPDAPVYAGDREGISGAEPFGAGRIFGVGPLTVSTFLTWGHSPGGITYLVVGLDKPVAVVGDALFAGSMGGGNASYADALATNREHILSLPPETILCPGHGPLTTVAQERQHNPFF